MATVPQPAGVVRSLRTRGADGLSADGPPAGWLRRLPHRYWRGLVVLAAIYAHVLTFPFLYRMLGGDAPAFAVVVTILAGAFWGIRGGLLCAVTISLVVVLQLDVLERLSGVGALYREGAPGALTLLIVGATVGRLRDLSDAVRRELARRREAEVAAEVANRAKSQFLSRMSHELRTPLNAILGFAQLLDLDPLSPEQRESVAHILRGGQHLLELVNEVLDISRIESGHLTMVLEGVPLPPMLQEALDLVRPLAAERSVRLYEDGGAAGRAVQADRQRLRQVLLNLLSNAVKYNRAGGTVTISCQELSPGHLRLSVRDTGRGIPADQLDQVFVPFARPGTANSGVEGVGIGLALSRALVRLMRGEIGVSSLVDQGTTFWVDLPAAEASAGAPLQDQAARQSAAAADAPYLVLYIGENLADLDLLRHVVNSRLQVRLLTARQAARGLEQTRQHRPDLILLDTELGDLTAEEVLHRLAGDPETRAIPVVIITAEGASGQVDRLIALGAQGHLAKPINVRHLLRTLEGLPRSRDGRREEVSKHDVGTGASDGEPTTYPGR
ncbi:MAG: ATP-binding response regulator [bacterium]